MHLRTITWLPLLSLNVALASKSNLGAVWCHWCHVMDEIMYRDPKVIELIRSHYDRVSKLTPANWARRQS